MSDHSPQNFQDCSFTVIGCAMNVHTALESGFQEVIYSNALKIEFRHVGLPFEREKELVIFLPRSAYWPP